MDSNTWLKHATDTLSSEGITSARLDALILLEDELKLDRAHILAEPEYINSSMLSILNKNLERRVKHEPLSFIRQKTDFFGREFYINKNVLEPRPESETMIELLIKHKFDSSMIADIGTGSGALAITTKLELDSSNVIAIDIDSKCLSVARINAQKLKANIKFKQGDLMMSLENQVVDILLANLPYVPDSWKLSPSTRFEPRLAIFGGKDGLDIYRKLFGQINNRMNKPNYIFTESLPFQHDELTKIAKSAHYKIFGSQDFIQVFRYHNY